VSTFGRDPRGPIRLIVRVEEIRTTQLPNHYGTCRPVVLDCGHTVELNQIYSYKVGEACRCYTCGQEGREQGR